ncbi:MAG: response regulator [Nitrospirae bacterium]|nr:response regulator [Nitrospirota bacterium]
MKVERKILVVDDDTMNRKLFRFLLQEEGYEVLEAEDGAAGSRLAREVLPHLVLMDIQMPLMDGLAAMKVLQADEATRSIPVIAITSYAMKGDRERLLKSGFVDYISKPIDKDAFMRSVKTTLERYHG